VRLAEDLLRQNDVTITKGDDGVNPNLFLDLFLLDQQAVSPYN
jgi:hypothetical protein